MQRDSAERNCTYNEPIMLLASESVVRHLVRLLLKDLFTDMTAKTLAMDKDALNFQTLHFINHFIAHVATTGRYDLEGGCQTKRDGKIILQY